MDEDKENAVLTDEEPVITATEGCRTCSRWREIKHKMRIATVLEAAVAKFEQKLKTNEFKPSIAEYLKLVQIEQEFEKEIEGTKEITVTWVEQQPTSENSK